MKGLNIVALALSLVVAGLAQAANFTVSDIRIEGLQQVEPGIVFRNFPISRGNQVDDQRLNDATRDLFATGYFDDVEILRDEDVLVLRLTERPAVSLIRIDGEKLIKEEQLRDALRRAGLDEGEIFRRSALELVRLELLKVYNEAGRYTASVETEVEEVSGNRVALNIVVTEGETAVVKQINIIGNNAFDDETLTDLFDTGLTNMWSFWTDNDKYARETVSADIERLKSYYLDRGYAKFEVNSTDVSISPDQKQVYITVSVSEGLAHRITDVKVAGDFGVLEEQALRSVIQVNVDDLFSRKRVSASQEAMKTILGDSGYLLANVNVVPELVAEDQIALTFFVAPGKLTYIRRIEIRGNSTTADEVVRRELTQMEGAIARDKDLKRSKVKLDRLGFFSKVQLNTTPVAGSDDLVDVLIEVEEQALGQFNAGVGFSSSEGFLFDLGLEQQNFLGSGKSFGFSFNNSKVLTEYSVRLNDPYYTLDGVSRGYDLYYRERDFADDDLSNYSTNEFGGNVSFGYPLSDIQRVRLAIGPDLTEVKLNSNAVLPTVISDFVGATSQEYLTYNLSLGWSYNSLNSGFFPTRGLSQNVDFDIAVPGGDLTYYKATYRNRFYYPLDIDETWVVGLKSRAGFGDSLDDRAYPFYKNFFAGGLTTLRGYANNSLGPRDGDDVLGGDILISGSVEVIFPIPFIDDKSAWRTSVFMDVGNVYSTNCGTGLTNCSENIELGDLRASAGVGLSWLTAIGPLSISFAKALNEQSGDQTDAVQFALGRTF